MLFNSQLVHSLRLTREDNDVMDKKIVLCILLNGSYKKMSIISINSLETYPLPLICSIRAHCRSNAAAQLSRQNRDGAVLRGQHRS